ncbi:hypothetical protein BJ741DRAFT_589568 [Chytriomyces cf. hyalinus JEL632]|nr:hypothetical protein BJ741DRAFT_589568 [Chytriomyces cf. hyalinus JEL632]
MDAHETQLARPSLAQAKTVSQDMEKLKQSGAVSRNPLFKSMKQNAPSCSDGEGQAGTDRTERTANTLKTMHKCPSAKEAVNPANPCSNAQDAVSVPGPVQEPILSVSTNPFKLADKAHTQRSSTNQSPITIPSPLSEPSAFANLKLRKRAASRSSTSSSITCAFRRSESSDFRSYAGSESPMSILETEEDDLGPGMEADEGSTSPQESKYPLRISTSAETQVFQQLACTSEEEILDASVDSCSEKEDPSASAGFDQTQSISSSPSSPDKGTALAVLQPILKAPEVEDSSIILETNLPNFTDENSNELSFIVAANTDALNMSNSILDSQVEELIDSSPHDFQPPPSVLSCDMMFDRTEEIGFELDGSPAIADSSNLSILPVFDESMIATAAEVSDQSLASKFSVNDNGSEVIMPCLDDDSLISETQAEGLAEFLSGLRLVEGEDDEVENADIEESQDEAIPSSLLMQEAGLMSSDCDAQSDDNLTQDDVIDEGHSGLDLPVGTKITMPSISLDLSKELSELLPGINLQDGKDWLNFYSSPTDPKTETDFFPDKSFQDFVSKCVDLGANNAHEDARDLAGSEDFFIKSPSTGNSQKLYVGDLDMYQFGPMDFEKTSSFPSFSGDLEDDEILIQEDRVAPFFIDELPSVEFDTSADLPTQVGLDILPEELTPKRNQDAITATVTAEEIDVPKQSGFKKLWRSDSSTSISSVFSGKSISSLWSKTRKSKNQIANQVDGAEDTKKRVRWGLARAGLLQQTKVYNPEFPVTPDPVPVSRENGILFFRLDSVSQIIVPDNQPVTIHLTLTYNSTTTFPVPPVTITNPEAADTPIDFECAFNLPSSSSQAPQQLDMTLRIAPILQTTLDPKNRSQQPQIAHQSRSIALPQIFRSKTVQAPAVAPKKNNSLPLGGISTRGVLIPDIRRMAEDSDGSCSEFSWNANFGATHGVKAQFQVKAVGLVKAISEGAKVNLPESYSEAAYGVQLKRLHETLHLQGFMSQTGGGLKAWRRRYFELVGSNLYAYNIESKKLMMKLDLTLVTSIRACGVAAIVTPKSQRCVEAASEESDPSRSCSMLDAGDSSAEISDKSGNVSTSIFKTRRGEIPRKRSLTASSNVDDANACHLANIFEIEMKDGECISLSTLGEAIETDAVPGISDGSSLPSSQSGKPAASPWWKIESNPDQISPQEGGSSTPEFCPILQKNFLECEFDEVFEDVGFNDATSGDVFSDAGEMLVDCTAPVTREWLRALCNAATTIADEAVPDWLADR